MTSSMEAPAEAQPQAGSGLPGICSAGCALPRHYADQETLRAVLRELWAVQHSSLRRWRTIFEQVQRTVRVDGRYLALTLDEYRELRSFADCNAAWARVAPELGQEALTEALGMARLGPRDVDHLFLVTTTGIATPSIDARIVNRAGMRSDVRRTPLFGLGCAGGVAGIARAADYLRGAPDKVAALVSVELCSLTLQRHDASIANVVASALFGDGAAAVVMTGGAHPIPGAARIVATHSVFYPETERVMGWDIVDGGFKIVLSSEIPAIVREHLRADVDAFLEAQGLERDAVSHWIVHTGGNRVLEAVEESLELKPGALESSWRLLAQTGNLSSASVLFVLADLLRSGAPRPGEYGLMIAMGPGFASEFVLLRW